jgi:hypothetical protein
LAGVHRLEDNCRRQLWLDELGTSGDLADLVRCEWQQRGFYESTLLEANPWHPGGRASMAWQKQQRGLQSAEPPLLIRTASNAYFPQVVSVLSLPDRGSAVDTAVTELGRPADRLTTPLTLPC